jgi:glycerol kinase
MTKVTLGTGSSILINVGKSTGNPESGVMTTLAWVHAKHTVYAHEGIIVSSASTLAWLRNNLGVIDDISNVEALASELDSNDGIYLVPAFTGLGLPHWAPSARAIISGLSSHSDKRHLIRAALEAIAYQLKDALDVMVTGAGHSLSSIHADGGPTANAFLMQFISDVTGIPIHVSRIKDGSPVGAAMMGMLGTDLVQKPEDFLDQDGRQPDYSPAMDPESVQSLYDGWQKAVRQALLT